MRIPTATYRIQFNPLFGFREAQRIVPYLAELGISDIYASPVFKARKGSNHGYDVVDPNRLNPELGTEQDFEELAGELRNHRMGWIQDIIPNHMAYDGENWRLMDVLENGKSSRFFHYFDIDWNHPSEHIGGRVLAPFLGAFYGECLENGEIRISYDQTGLTVNYYHLRFPLKIESYARIFTHNLDRLKNQLGSNHPDFIKLLGVLYVVQDLPSREEDQERGERMVFVKRMLWELYTQNRKIRKFVDENLATFNGKKGDPESFNLLDSLLAEQLFRLSFWKVAGEEINYRRFFNINELISLRVEEEDVFYDTHSLIFKLVREKEVTGLRIDHIDGLYDPTGYLKRLRNKTGEIYLVVEKILGPGESLPSFWPGQGTTGYDFLNYLNWIFCETTNERKLDRIYTKFTGLTTPYEDLLGEKKRLIIGKRMAGDIDNLAQIMMSISRNDRYGIDITRYGLKRALVEVLTYFPVYRTYIGDHFGDTDHRQMAETITKAKLKNTGLLNEFNFIERFLLLDFQDYLSEDEKNRWIHFIMRLQQFTGALMAKGFEDTALYVYNRLLSLNEVGGTPNKFGIPTGEFHDFNKKRMNNWAHSLNATSTHDTKRGEDVRARINALSELPGEWERNIKVWKKIIRKKKKTLNGQIVPDSNDEYLLYQTLIGAFPFAGSEYPEFIERLKKYIVKAVREAKVHTAWLKPDTEYENAFISVVEEILDLSEKNQFLKEFLPFQKKIAYYGIFNSLAQTLVKITSPGVPDFYQGSELWDLNLVDPDNRRPVDFEKRRNFLFAIKEKEVKAILSLIEELLSTREDGRIKLFTIYRALQRRELLKELFDYGAYLPLKVTGSYNHHIIAFARQKTKSWALTVVPRFLTSIIKPFEFPLGKGVWLNTSVVLPDNAPVTWHHVFTDQVIKSESLLPVGEVCQHFPLGFLIGEGT
jgi:(1->4)-alpha-D-glucan 1-alpha-D-glucosylmutase